MPSDEGSGVLPAGWSKRESSSRPGKFYYYNKQSRVTTWERPSSNKRSRGAGKASPEKKRHKKAEKGETVSASHILAKHTDSRKPRSWRQDPITRSKEEAVERVTRFHERLKSLDANDLETEFVRIATKESDCSSAKRGGALGEFGRKRMQKAFEDAAFALKIGQLSSLVHTASGVHIILRTA